jgi:hypothetical protein
MLILPSDGAVDTSPASTIHVASIIIHQNIENEMTERCREILPKDHRHFPA